MQREEEISEANQEDLRVAKARGLNDALLERLSLEKRLSGIIRDLDQIIHLPDPVGVILEERTLPNQLKIAKYRTPIGVLAAIYESRPNVTLDISALAIKSGNCVILKGGRETSLTSTLDKSGKLN